MKHIKTQVVSFFHLQNNCFRTQYWRRRGTGHRGKIEEGRPCFSSKYCEMKSLSL